MAVPTNTIQHYSRVGNREDLSNIIYDITPTDTPFFSMLPRESCTQSKPEWQTDALVAANGDNKVVEGDDTTADSRAATTRLNTYTQLMDKQVNVSSTQEATDHAGIKSMMAYQIARSGKELKRDIETRFCGNYASVAGNASTAAETAGFPAWIETNTSFGTGGSAGGFSSGTVSAATNGTQRAFTETLLKAVLKSCWDNGGDPRWIMVGSFNKQAASAFSGIATQYRDHGANNTKQANIIAAADVYVGDFGTYSIIANRFSPARTALVIDSEYWSASYLQNFKTEPLAKTGHSTKRLMSVELALCSKNEGASGAVFDLTTS
jgi:hypothetical protein